MTATTVHFDEALAHAREAVDSALDALNQVKIPHVEFVVPLLDAQANLKRAAFEYTRLGEPDDAS